MNKFFILSMLLFPLNLILAKAKVTINNDTKAIYFALLGDKGYLLESGQEAIMDIPEAGWLDYVWSSAGIKLYKKMADGTFLNTFSVKPKVKGDEPAIILLSDVHRKVRGDISQFSVKTSKRVVKQPKSKKIKAKKK